MVIGWPHVLGREADRGSRVPLRCQVLNSKVLRVVSVDTQQYNTRFGQDAAGRRFAPILEKIIR